MRIPRRLLALLVTALMLAGVTVPSVATATGVPAIALPASLAYTENAGAVALASTATVAYSSGPTLSGATVQITGNYVAGEDVLDLPNSAVTPSLITGSFDAVAGTLTLTGTASTADYQTALRAVTYTDMFDYPSTSTRTVRFTASDGATSGSTDMTVTVTPVNDPPILAGLGGVATFTEGGAPVTLAGAMTLADADNANLASATVSITGNFATGQDVLSVLTPAGLSVAYDASTGVLTLSGSASKATYRTALRSVRYTNSSENPSAGARTMTFRLNDGTDWSAPGTSTVNVVAVNDAPIVTTGGGATAFTEGGGAVAVDAGVTVVDVDDATLTAATVQVTGNFASGEDELGFTNTSAATYGNVVGSYNASTGMLTLSSAGGTATVAQWQAALRTVTYLDTSATPGTSPRTVSFVASDASTGSAPATRSVTVTAVNTRPVVTTTPGITAFTGGGGPVVVDSGVDVQDPDTPVTTATAAITTGFAPGQDVLALPAQASGITGTYDATTGVLTLTSGAALALPQWQAALRAVTYDNTSQTPSATTRQVRFTAGDGVGTSDGADKAVSVTGAGGPTPEAPTPGPQPAAQPAPAPDDASAAAVAPARLRGTTRMQGRVTVTTGRVPDGATRVTQTAEPIAGSTARQSAAARPPASTRSCAVTRARTSLYACRITLSQGRWRLTTRAIGPAGVVAESVTTMRVRTTGPRGTTAR